MATGMGGHARTNDRLLPSNTGPGAVTAAISRGLRPGEMGTDVLERVGADIMPPDPAPLTKQQRQARKLPRQVAAIIGCRIEGMTDTEIARQLGLATTTVRNILCKARKRYGLSDIVDRVEHRAVHTAVDNLIDGLDGKKGPETEETYTLATLKGVGVFRSHQAIKADTTETISNELRVVFEMPEGVAPQVAIGAITATPRRLTEKQNVIEGEVARAV